MDDNQRDYFQENCTKHWSYKLSDRAILYSRVDPETGIKASIVGVFGREDSHLAYLVKNSHGVVIKKDEFHDLPSEEFSSTRILVQHLINNQYFKPRKNK
jgi:hypothetical protein